MLFVGIQIIKLLPRFLPKSSNKGSVSASHILVKEESKAKELLAKLEKNPEKFSQLAKENSTCPSGMCMRVNTSR